MKTKTPGAVHAALLTMCLVGTLQSCVDHTLPEVNVDECLHTVSYASEVDPIVNTNCAITDCHNGDNGADKNWTVFSNFQSRVLM